MRLWDKDVLNSEQEDAIFCPGNVLLVACPGSGKTRALTYKIAYELDRLNSSTRSVIAITYTNAAAEEIKERIELIGVDTNRLWIGTIHSFCLEWILRPYHHLLEDFKFGFKIASPHDYEDLMDEICRPYQNPQIRAGQCGYYYTSTNMVISDSSITRRPKIERILRSYHARLIEERTMDFEMILYYSHLIIVSFPAVAKILTLIFAHILVDEYQDTKEIQYSILTKIISAGHGRTLAFIVGDPNQSIYQSMGGYSMSIEELIQRSGAHFTAKFLTGNYRSSSEIIEYFDHYKTTDNVIEPRGVHHSYESKITYNSTVELNDLVEEITRLITVNVNVLNIFPEEICVIGPRWIPLALLTRALMVRMPEFNFNGPGMAPFARDYDNFFFKLCRIALTEPSPDLYVRRLKWAGEIIDELTNLGFNCSKITAKMLLKTVNQITIEENNGIEYLRLFFDSFLNHFDIHKPSSAQLTAHYEAFFRASERRIQSLLREGQDYIITIENFRRVFRQRDGITVSTIHGVKGAEFDTVIVFALLEDYVPHFSDGDRDGSAKKTLYVACSRAKRNLHLISERGRPRAAWLGGHYEPTTVLHNHDFDYDVF
ncbi:UvrD-helicase domain-containing protein [Chitinophaga arvensicola]|uniref:DNA 3'-5' helicase n=1 Tax=Chitinophaga arvensicola TaxID=29529 RepID=A0A1I0S7A4_9BACT|nr:ATP-dependent helicase [Chitinophaga arvensicola]SEW51627.1 Superfamily I DNA or RNA helicase [Chitinophaga arvensicola]